MKSQVDRLLQHFEQGKVTTLRGAMIDFGVASLTRRVADLRERGHNIQKNMKRNPVTGQRYAEYYLAD